MSKPSDRALERTDKILHAKLMPPRLPSTVVQRGELLARLNVGLAKKVSLVTAPTGFGKTTLVRMWVASRDFQSAWVTLDENDNDPTRFWAYVVSALRVFDSQIGKSMLSALLTSQPPVFQTLLTSLINDLATSNEQYVLVLEDFHAITLSEIHAGVSFLIQHAPDSLHLVLISRTSPELPLALLRVRDELTEITAADLRFDPKETDEFLRLASLADVSSSKISKLLQKTEGWVAGLRLLMLSMQNKSNVDIERFVETFSGSNRYVADYLIKEVFAGQTEDIQTFLLKTCFFRRMTGSLCDAITETNGNAAILEQLAHDNLFVEQLEPSGDQVWYRYHPLFAEAIQYLAKQKLDKATYSLLFEKASSWYEYQGLLDEAIQTALAVKLFERAILLITRFIEIHDITEWLTLTRWLENIPDELIFRYPIICFAYAQVILYGSDRFAPATLTRIEPLLRAAEQIFRAEEKHGGIGEVLSFRGMAHWWQGNFKKAFEEAHRSLEELPEDDALYRGTSMLILSYEDINAGRIFDAQDKALEARALLGAAQNIFGVLGAIQMLADIFYRQGELKQSEELNRQILNDAVGDVSMLDDQGIASLGLAHIAYEKDDLEQAEGFGKRALHLGQQRANQMLELQAAIRLAHVYAAKGDSSRARDLVKSFERKIHSTSLLRELQNTQILLSIRENDLSSLEWWLRTISVENEGSLYMQKESEAYILARLKIAQSKTTEALDLLQTWKIDSAENGRVRSLAEALCLEALAHYANSNLLEATRSIHEALTIGQSKGFARIFLDEGAPLAALLQVIFPTLTDRMLSLFASALLQSFSAAGSIYSAAVNSTSIYEALSQQELRVLRLLVAGLANADIAQELIVSTNTVKTHVKSIYRKLNVKSRREAREVVREMKLL